MLNLSFTLGVWLCACTCGRRGGVVAAHDKNGLLSPSSIGLFSVLQAGSVEEHDQGGMRQHAQLQRRHHLQLPVGLALDRSRCLSRPPFHVARGCTHPNLLSTPVMTPTSGLPVDVVLPAWCWCAAARMHTDFAAGAAFSRQHMRPLNRHG